MCIFAFLFYVLQTASVVAIFFSRINTKERERESFHEPCGTPCAIALISAAYISTSCWWSRQWGTDRNHINACAISTGRRKFSYYKDYIYSIRFFERFFSYCERVGGNQENTEGIYILKKGKLSVCFSPYSTYCPFCVYTTPFTTIAGYWESRLSIFIPPIEHFYRERKYLVCSFLWKPFSAPWSRDADKKNTPNRERSGTMLGGRKQPRGIYTTRQMQYTHSHRYRKLLMIEGEKKNDTGKKEEGKRFRGKSIE